jgi:hypothetical protein
MSSQPAGFSKSPFFNKLPHTAHPGLHIGNCPCCGGMWYVANYGNTSGYRACWYFRQEACIEQDISCALCALANDVDLLTDSLANINTEELITAFYERLNNE